ncbi:hypothetical protein ACVCL0_09120 [Rhodanobacter sp. UC4450_H17]
MKLVAGLLAVGAIALGLLWAGHHRGYDDGAAAVQKAAQTQIRAAATERNQAIGERDALAQTLAQLRQTLTDQKRALQVANFYADAAIAESGTLRKQLSAATAARELDLRKAAHATPECADLARLPVCPAVAERLWGTAAGAPPGANH